MAPNNGLLGISQQARSHYNGRPPHGPTVTQAPDGTLAYRPTNAEDGEQSGTSVFDPVLCELVYRWFAPTGGTVLDPFAGGSVRGIVASRLGLSYVGIELREEQVAANREQAERICADGDVAPIWHVGDSRNLPTLAGDVEADLVFTCPPYFDLELYSDDPCDLSNAADYDAFIALYREITKHSIDRLKPNRFAVAVVGDIRDKRGFYRNFVADTISAYEDAGATLYNEAILVTAVGSLSIRVGRQFVAGRKLGKTHQNVLVFYKGDPRKIGAELGDVDPRVYLDPREQESGVASE